MKIVSIQIELNGETQLKRVSEFREKCIRGEEKRKLGDHGKEAVQERNQDRCTLPMFVSLPYSAEMRPPALPLHATGAIDTRSIYGE